ncbi:MAG: hypothetical protein HYU75_03235 [Betaproteobacteria bacterium]|nr:hypothetical protein [Betaproteobacteria bacterium]
MYVINKGIYDKISAGDRTSMRRLGMEAEKRSVSHLEQVEIKSQALMKSQKADIYAITDAERSELRKGIASSYAKMGTEGGAAGKEIGDVLKRYW